MASSMRETLEGDTFQKSYDVLCAIAVGVRELGDPRLRFEPVMPQSAMTHICVRCPGNPGNPGNPGKGDRMLHTFEFK